MNIPVSVSSLISFLEHQCHLIVIESAASPSFGDKLIVMRGGAIAARLLSDRGSWFVELGLSEQAGEFYDIALIKEYLTGSIGKDVLSFDEQASFVKTSWKLIEGIFLGEDFGAARLKLATLREERVGRRFPGFRLTQS